MNREIKLRAWIIDENKMSHQDDWFSIWPFNAIQFAEQGFWCNNANTSDEHKKRLAEHNIEAMDEFILMQFTGLIDFNGKDIYEGDIVQWGHRKSSKEDEIRVAEVKIDPCISFDCRNIKYPYVFKYANFAYKSTELEIIGNVYEHPHLLKPSTK